MNLSVGIVGLPNVGKSTLFNALLKRQAALVANYPFATIEPNIGIVPVPDERLEKLRKVIEGDPSLTLRMTDKPKVVPATVKFVDIAGLVAGASKGEGLGNQFLAHIRETDLIVHVLRDFSDPDVARAGSENPIKDLETVRMELCLKDLETIEKVQNAKGKDQNHSVKIKAILDKAIGFLAKGVMLNQGEFTDKEWEVLGPLFLLTIKPELVVLNVSEELLSSQSYQLLSLPNIKKEDIIILSAKLESELSSLADEDQRAYLADLKIEESGLEKLIKRAYEKLGLISFLTAGEKEVRAWTIKDGMSAVEAAGVIHSDFKDKFIKVKVILYDEFVKVGGWTKARIAGKIRLEGRDYQIKEGEIVEFMIGN